MTQQSKAQQLIDSAHISHRVGWQRGAVDEMRRLHEVECAYKAWQDKTEWVQDTVQARELGRHRADVLRQRIESLEAVNAQLLEALELVMADVKTTPNAYEAQRQAIAAAKERT